MFDKKIKNVAAVVNKVLRLEEIDPNVRTKDTTKGEEPTKQRDDVGPGSDGKSTKVKFRGGPMLSKEDFKEKLFKSLEEANEEMLSRYMKSRGYNPETTPKDKKIAITKSNEFKKWLNDHQFEETQYDSQDYTDEELTEMINEVLSKDASAGDWISDFVHSDNPKFKGKSKEKRKKMALAAYYAHQREEVEIEEDAVATVRGKDKKGSYIATLRRKAGEHEPKEVARKYDEEVDLEEAKRPESDTVPFEQPYSDVKPDVKDKGTGGTHTPMSRVRHLARVGLKKVKNEVLGKAGMTSEESEQLGEATYEKHDSFKHEDGGEIALHKQKYTGGEDKWEINHTSFQLNSKHPRSGGDFVSKTLHSGTGDAMKEKFAELKKQHMKEETEQVNEISGELASRYLQKKHDRDYEKTGTHTSRRKEPQTIDQAMKDGRNTVRALKRIGPLSKIGKKAK